MNSFIAIIICVTTIIISYFIGYTNGFKKCKKINNTAIKELIDKYKQQLKEIS